MLTVNYPLQPPLQQSLLIPRWHLHHHHHHLQKVYLSYVLTFLQTPFLLLLSNGNFSNLTILREVVQATVPVNVGLFHEWLNADDQFFMGLLISPLSLHLIWENFYWFSQSNVHVHKGITTTCGPTTLKSVCIFSLLFSIHFLRCWQGEIVF